MINPKGLPGIASTAMRRYTIGPSLTNHTRMYHDTMSKAYVQSRRELGIVVKILVMSWNCTWSRLIGLEKIGFKETKSKSERSIRAMVQTGESNQGWDGREKKKETVEL